MSFQMKREGVLPMYLLSLNWGFGLAAARVVSAVRTVVHGLYYKEFSPVQPTKP
jgi:hypothetical protein